MSDVTIFVLGDLYMDGVPRESTDEASARRRRREWGVQMMKFFEEHEADPPEFFRAADVARAVGCGPEVAGKLIQEAFGVYPVGRKYPSAAIYASVNGGNSHDGP